MRIADLELVAYGPFTGKKIEFSGNGKGIDIVFGLNEHGKSTALRALRAWLYEIPRRTPDAFRHNLNDLAICGTVIGSDGSKLHFTRKKKGLFDEDDEAIHASELDRMLAGISEDTFSHLFAIDHEALVAGGEDIAMGKGEVGQSLFTAALSRTGLPEILRMLEKEGEALFRNGARSGPEILKLRKELEDIKKEISHASLSGRKWEEEATALASLENEGNELGEKIVTLEKEKTRLERLNSAMPKNAGRKLKLKDLEELGDVIVLPDDFGEDRNNANHLLSMAMNTLQSAGEHLVELENEAKKHKFTSAILDNEDRISELYKRSGSIKKAMVDDCPGLEGELGRVKLEIDNMLVQLGDGITIETAGEMRPDTASRARIQDLGRRLQEITSGIKGAEKDVSRLEKEIKRIKGDVSNLGAERNPAALKQCLKQVQKAGNLEAEALKISDEISSERERLEVALSSLRFWDATAEKLAGATLPMQATVEKYENALNDLMIKIEKSEEKQQETLESISEMQEKIKSLVAAGAVPSEEDLEKAREHREAGWSLVKKAWLDGLDISLESREYASGDDFPQAYERSVEGADEISDRLRREANRVAENASLVAELEKLEERRENLEKSITELQDEQEKLQQKWINEWKTHIEKPGSPREMREWLGEKEVVVQHNLKVKELERNLGAINKDIGDHKTLLIESLASLGEKPPLEEISLEALIDFSSDTIRAIEDMNTRRNGFQDQIKQFNEDLDDARNQREESNRELKEWREKWAKEVKSIGLTSESLPTEAEAVLENLAALFNYLKDARSLESRIQGIKSDYSVFEKDVIELMEDVELDLPDKNPDKATSEMEKELKKAKADKAAWDRLNEAISTRKKEIKEAEKSKKKAGEELNRLCGLAKCDNTEELPEAERKSKKYQELEKEIKSLETQMVELYPGKSLEELIKDIDDLDPDSIPGDIKNIKDEIGRLKPKKTTLDQEIGSKRAQFNQMDGSAEAADLAEKAQEVISRLGDKVKDYLKLRMAFLVLREQIERFREENEQPMLTRASELFSTLTCGSFNGIKTIYDDKDKTVLVGARQTGELVDISGMSDGTMDQLYLSLRLAALEKQMEDREPMPFIVDDILIRFDDERAMATLQVLEELSIKTQVIFFTHHSRLVDLAKKVAGEDLVNVQEL